MAPFLLFPDGESPPRIVEHPTSLVVPRGDPATLNCAADGNPTPKITWFKDNRPVSTSEDDPLSHRLLLPLGSLFFLSIKQSKRETDAGVYHCLASNPHGRAASNNATLTIAVLREEFRIAPQDISVSSGSRAELKCSPPRGHPPPTIFWTRNEHEIDFEQEGKRVEQTEEGSLILKEVLQTDEGEYVCHALNDAGKRRSPSAILNVIVPPFWVKAPRDVVGVAGGTAEISCRVGGDPPPTITWRRVGGPMPVGRATVVKGRGLRLSPLHPDDEGVYVCDAVNTASAITANASITVHTAPQVVEVPGDLEVEEGAPFRLSCGVEGEPAPLIYWTREGSQSVLTSSVNPLAAGGRMVGILAVFSAPRAARHHSGRYVCGAVNPAGGVMTRIIVRIRPSHLLPPPIISIPPANQTLHLRGHAALTCRVWGEPEPLVSWRHRGRPLRPSARHKIHPDNTLTIDELSEEDRGLYTCVASSNRGVTEATAELKVVSPVGSSVVFVRAPDPDTAPGPPPTPTVLRSNGSTALLQWSPPNRQGASSVTSYMVEFYSSGGGAWQVAARGVKKPSYVLRGLDPGQSYGVTVRAQNVHGISEPSGIAEVGGGGVTDRTIPVEISSRLQKAKVILQEANPVASSSAKILWQMTGEAASVEGFYIRLHHIARDDSVLTSITREKQRVVALRKTGTAGRTGGLSTRGLVTTRSFVSKSLLTKGDSSNKGYSDTKIPGLLSSSSFFHSLPPSSGSSSSSSSSSPPSPPSSSPFLPPIPPSVYSNHGNSSVVTVLNAGPGASSYVIHGLHHYRAYTVFLVPFYGTLEGQPSNTRSFFTPEAAPTAPPSNVGVQLANVTTASVFWSPPSNLHRNGPITSYHVEVVSSEGGIFLSKIVDGNETSLIIHNLTLGHSYHLTLAASTHAGRGPFCSPVSLHVDPVLLHPLAKSGTSLASLDGDVWVIGLIGAAVFCLLLMSVASLLLWRRHTRNKALGHVGVSVHKVDNLTAGDGCLWQEYSGWHLEKCGSVHTHTINNGTESKVMNTSAAVGEGDPQPPRSMITFYRGHSNSEGPYATTSLLLPQNSGSHHPSLKVLKSEVRSCDSIQDQNSHGKISNEAAFFTGDGNATLHRLKGNRTLFTAPPLPCLPPPGVPTDSRSQTPCYCSVSRGSLSIGGESAYSEAHYTPTMSIRPCFPQVDPHQYAHKDVKTQHSQAYQNPQCPAHIYASALPSLPLYPENVASRPSLTSPATSHHHLCRNSAVYESTSLQYAPAGYFLPPSSTGNSSGTNSVPDGTPGQVPSPGYERGRCAAQLPSVTYEALRALSQDIEAFRQRQKMQDEESKGTPTKSGSRAAKGASGDADPNREEDEGRSNHTLDSLPNPSSVILPSPTERIPSFDAPAPPKSPPPTTRESSHPHSNSLRAPTSNGLQQGATKGSGLKGGSLTPPDVGVAPLGEGESDCLDDDLDDECSQCSCSCSEAESSVYAETEFADEVRQALQEPGMISIVGIQGRKHNKHKRKRPTSGYSSDSNYTNFSDIPHIGEPPCRCKSFISSSVMN